MSDPPSYALRKALHGIQLGVFEVVWSTFPWIRTIWIRSEGRPHLHIQTAATPEQKDKDDCVRLLQELVEVARQYHPGVFGIDPAFFFDPGPPGDMGYIELMSDNIFRQIAEQYAPWRLTRGR